MSNDTINVDFTVNSGQVFLWSRHKEFWYGIDGRNILKCDGTGIIKARCKARTSFFRADDGYGRVAKAISGDGTVKEAVRRYPGLRLLRQDPFQCCVSFIASSNSSIQKIRSCLKVLCRKFGRKVHFDGMQFHLFPEPSSIADATVDDIRRCGFGYRSEYIRDAAGMVAGGQVSWKEIRGAGYYEAKGLLRRMPGIGNKVADCILLFSLDKTEAFPLDRWTARILQKYYPGRFAVGTKCITDRQYDRLHGEIARYFGPYAGYAQQFLFKMERDGTGRGWL